MTLAYTLIALAAAFGGIYLFIDACATLLDGVDDE